MKRELILSVLVLSAVFAVVGSVRAEGSVVSTAWAEPEDGEWLDAEAWTNGVPVAGSLADIVVPGDYTVTMKYLVTDVPSLLTVGGGAVLDIPCAVSTWQYPLALLTNGTVRISGKSLLTPEVFSKIAFSGGVIEYAASGITNVWGATDTTLTNVNLRLAGESDTGIGDFDVSGLALSLVSTNDGQVSQLAMTNSSHLWLPGGRLALGAFDHRGLARLEVAAGRGDADLLVKGTPESMVVGYEGGTGIVSLASGRLVMSKGVTLGGGSPVWFNQTEETRAFNPVGIVEQSGGVVEADGLSVTTAECPTGILIGDGSRPGSSAQASFRGEWRMTGGDLDCRRGYLMIGLGKGEGVLDQSGGIVTHTVRPSSSLALTPMVVGWKGGTGTWKFTGTAQTDFGADSELYLGGMDDSHLLRSFNWVSLYSIKSSGTLIVDDGATFRGPTRVILGESGEGHIQIGPTAAFKGEALVATAGSNSSIMFTAGDKGFGTMRLSGSFAGDSALKIIVDFSGRSPVGKATLIEAESVAGIETTNVEVRNLPAEREAEITVDGTSVVVGLKSGSLVIVR